MKNLKQTWTYNHISLVIIAGLLVGILLPHFHINWPQAEAVTYTKEEVADCDYKCAFDKELLTRTERIYNEQKAHHMELSRLEALQEMGTVVASQMDNSPYVDYANLEEKFGY